jgi:hypothetical protein
MMSLRTHSCRSPNELRDALDGASAPAADLLSSALDLMSTHCALPDRADRARRIRALIDAQAWIDAALAIVDLDRSHAVRQISHDDGEWSCRIGSRWAIPDWLDNSVQFTHRVLPLAILGALLDARAQSEEAVAPATSVPLSRSGRGYAIPAVSCDNYI